MKKWIFGVGVSVDGPTLRQIVTEAPTLTLALDAARAQMDRMREVFVEVDTQPIYNTGREFVGFMEYAVTPGIDVKIRAFVDEGSLVLNLNVENHDNRSYHGTTATVGQLPKGA